METAFYVSGRQLWTGVGALKAARIWVLGDELKIILIRETKSCIST